MAVEPQLANGRRFFRPGELPLVVLALLEQEPANGYQLLVRLQTLFAPAYEPSTGSVYPALAALESEGLIDSAPDGRSRTFTITPDGAALLHHKPEVIAGIENRTGRRLDHADATDAAIARFVEAVKALGLPPDELAAALERALLSLTRNATRGRTR